MVTQKGWFVHQRISAPRPRMQVWVSRAGRSNERWTMDVTHIPCGQDDWAHLAAVIDCLDREVIGYEFALHSRAKEADRAVEAACLQRFGTLRPVGAPVLRSDNGLIFQSRRFRLACRDYRLCQEFITPYTTEQNGIIERIFRSLKEECVWQHTFQTFEEARPVIRDWVQWYNQERPHQAFGYRSPVLYRAQQATQVA
jgi:putative transposase